MTTRVPGAPGCSAEVLSGPEVAAPDVRLREVEEALARALAQNEQLKAEFRQAQKMETVGHLASGVAHDFKNVLTLIAGYADALLAHPDQPSSRESILEIRSACDRAMRLAQQLLAHGRKQAADQQPLSLNAILEEARVMLRRMVDERIDLTILPDRALGLVAANPGQMHQVLLNLVLNARDAMPAGGRLVVSVRNSDAAPGSPEAAAGAPLGPHVVLTVSDNGRGMDEATRERAFEPFFTTKDGAIGTGLGLPTVHSIITESRGRVHIASAPGAGTEVSVYLPRIAAAGLQQRASAPQDAADGRRAARILVVDDDESVRTLMCNLLVGAGYEVEALGRAVPAAAPLPFDLAVVDMSSLPADRAAVAGLAERAGRVLVISGSASPAPSAASARFRISDTIGKPIVPWQLLRAVRDLLEAD